MAFLWFGKRTDDNMQRKLLEFSDEIRELTKEMESVRKKLDDVEIIALESKKKYADKLKKLTSKDDIEEDSDNYLGGVILPERPER